MISKNKTVVVSAVFFVFLFAISILPATSAGAVVNTYAQSNDSLNVKPLTLTTGITTGTFSNPEDYNYYTLDVIPGVWNITIEAGNVSQPGQDMYCNLQQQITYYSSYLEENVTEMDSEDNLYLLNNEAESFKFDGGLPEGVPIINPGQLSIRLRAEDLNSDFLGEPWHYKIYVSYQAPISLSDGNIIIEMGENQARLYTFSVPSTNYYNFTHDANTTNYKAYLYSEIGDRYYDFQHDDSELFYFEAGLTYYYIVYSEDEDVSYKDGEPLKLELSLNQQTFDETIIGTGSTILNFPTPDTSKYIHLQGNGEGLYQILLNGPPTMDIAFEFFSLSSTDSTIQVDSTGSGQDENITYFIRTIESLEFWEPIFGYEPHTGTLIVYSYSNDGGPQGDFLNLWSDEHFIIQIYALGDSGNVNLTVTELPINAMNFGTPETFTINETYSHTTFKVVQFESKMGYEYNVSITPDPTSHEGGVRAAESLYVGLDAELVQWWELEASSEYNFTVYHNIIGGTIGSTDQITSYFIFTVESIGVDSGRLTVTIEEIAPTEINIDDEITKAFSPKDKIAVYKVELEENKVYNVDFQMTSESLYWASITFIDEKGQKPNFDAQFPVDESWFIDFQSYYMELDDDSPTENTMTLVSNSDQTLYLLVRGDRLVEISLMISEVDVGDGVGGIALFLLVAAIPLAFMAGILMYKNYPELFSRGTS